MKQKIERIILVMLVTSIFLFSVAQVYARTLGVDLLTLTINRAAAIVGIYTPPASQEITNERIQVEKDTLNYVDEFIKGIDQEIKDYTNQQKDQAKGKLRQNYNNVKSELDAVRQAAVDDAKARAQQIIEAQYQQEELILIDDLNKKVEEKLK